MDNPKLREAVGWFLLAALMAAIAWKVERIPEWLRVFLIIAAAFIGAAGMIALWNVIWHLINVRIKETGEARVYGATTLAFALHGLTTYQTELVARHDATIVAGLLGEERVFWMYRAPGGDVPRDFLREFLEKSREAIREVNGKEIAYLWPIRKHDALAWENSEELCKIATELIVFRGWAEKVNGPYAARLLTTIDYIEEMLEV